MDKAGQQPDLLSQSITGRFVRALYAVDGGLGEGGGGWGALRRHGTEIKSRSLLEQIFRIET